MQSRGNSTVTQSSRALNELSTEIIKRSFMAQEMTEQLCLRKRFKVITMLLASANLAPVISYIIW